MMERFHYTTRSGETLDLPRIGNVPAGIWRKIRNETSNLEITFALLEGVCTPEQLEIVDRMPLDEVNGLCAEWQGITSPGESSGSSPSSTSTEEPSSTTGDTGSTAA